MHKTARLSTQDFYNLPTVYQTSSLFILTGFTSLSSRVIQLVLFVVAEDKGDKYVVLDELQFTNNVGSLLTNSQLH